MLETNARADVAARRAAKASRRKPELKAVGDGIVRALRERPTVLKRSRSANRIRQTWCSWT